MIPLSNVRSSRTPRWSAGGVPNQIQNLRRWHSERWKYREKPCFLDGKVEEIVGDLVDCKLVTFGCPNVVLVR